MIRPGNRRIGELLDESRCDVRAVFAEDVVLAVQVGDDRHLADQAVAAAVGSQTDFQHLLGEAISFDRRVKRPRPEVVFLHIAGHAAGIRAGRADGHDLAHAGAGGGIEKVHPHQHVVMKDLRGLRHADAQPAVIGRRVHDDPGPHRLERADRAGRVEEVEIGSPGSGNFKTVPAQGLGDPAAEEPAAARQENASMVNSSGDQAFRRGFEIESTRRIFTSSRIPSSSPTLARNPTDLSRL